MTDALTLARNAIDRVDTESFHLDAAHQLFWCAQGYLGALRDIGQLDEPGYATLINQLKARYALALKKFEQ
ncbi:MULTISPECIES: hypothetical protein [unclassified Pseudomonas]|uniref:hypothetical protein n=1 Tax=unclassified Pseudomonas TaxID=196821 RepID=UPI000BD8A835|nr:MULTISPECIES: hypothetical protein [unclassified Pseudomonas]PVZ20392.1 hypothetical protein F474_00992 [Pseudomonas sp. URIL14HWK12:I12]PVZ27458.1 hypothetical protein F470_00647 [Pseudomonas sp. URIL14HWK12:I10]PVZ38347.1 hypothetical protein F472_00992 [Pseudomonas sp. URIL14HWK12:I11]SNZ03719.1 hypothetical protein SAMN05660463_00412 [Pseudomonas sp. URIL14HWK12:I9]